MSGALAIIAEALARIEHKLDVLITGFHFGQALPPMSFTGLQCPVCNKVVEYQVDLMNQVVKRVCGCSSGKQPPLIPLIPMAPQEIPDASRHRAEPPAAPEPSAPEDRPRRKER